jgi:hypothetical protein
MIKSTAFLVLFLYHFHFCFAQDAKSDTNLSSFFKLDLGGQGIGLTYEPRLSNKMTADISAGIGGSYEIAEGSIEINYGRPSLYFSFTPKYFYNRRSRIEKGKKTLFNAGNYFGLRIKYVALNQSPTSTYSNSILANIHWGIQRPLGKHWTFSSHFGAGYAQDIDYNFGTIYPAVDFKFSYIFFQSKK